MDKTINFRGVLPPGDIENKKVTYGILWIRLGDLKLLKRADSSDKIMVWFWGDKTPVILQAANCINPEYNRRAEYEVRSPVVFFHKYLADMKAFTKIQVGTIGTITLDFRPLLLSVTERSKSPFQHFKGPFQIVQRGKKQGVLEIQMACTFNPDIYDLVVEENLAECSKCCECDSQVEAQCHCDCHQENVKRAVDIIQVRQPWKLHQIVEEHVDPIQESKIKDTRIPNSLNVQMPSDSQFQPLKYKDASPKLQPIQPHDISQIKMPKQPSFQPERQLDKDFPQFEKVLTYSNLKLQKDPSEKDLTGKAERLKREFYGQNYNYDQPGQEQADRHSQSPRQSIDNYSQHLRPSNFKPILTPVQKYNPPNMIQRLDSKSSQHKSDNQARAINMVPYQIQESQVISPRVITRPVMPLPIQIPRYQASPRIPLSPGEPGLLLNLYCQLDGIKLDAPVLFYLIYKIYGNSERNRIEYKGDPVVIVSPVGAQQVGLMDKLPFIVEVRDTRDNNKLIGVLRLALGKIKDAFLLHGRINEKAVRVNIMPTVIYQGVTSLASLKAQTVGRCNVTLLIGTGQQISNYINNKTTVEQKNLGKEEIRQSPPQKDQKLVDLVELLTQLLLFIKNNNAKIGNVLLFNHKEMTMESFGKLLQDINHIELLPLFNLLDYRHNGVFPVKILSDSFQDFIRVEDDIKSLRAESNCLLKTLDAAVIANIQGQSQFGLVSKVKLGQILAQLTLFSKLQISTILRGFEGSFVSLELLKTCSWESSSPPTLFYGQFVSERLKRVIMQEKLQLSSMMSSMDKLRVIHFQEVNKVFKAMSQGLSLWATLALIRYIKNTTQDKTPGDTTLSYGALCTWVLVIKDQIERERVHSMERDRQRRNQIETKKRQEQSKRIEIQNINRERQLQARSAERESISQQDHMVQTVKVKPSLQEPDHPQNQDINNQSPAQIPQHVVTQAPVAIIPTVSQESALKRHRFTICGSSLSLNVPMSGHCLISYSFPHQPEPVLSKSLLLHPDKHKYDIRMVGKHSIVLNTPIQSYLGDSILKIEASIGGKVVATSGVPCAEMMVNETKVLGMFSVGEEQPILVGKIRLDLEYSWEPAGDHQLGQTISREMYLPKAGFLNVRISCAVQPKKLAQQHKLQADFFGITFQPFFQSSELSSLYKPIQSKIQSSISQVTFLYQHFKMRLTATIVQYMKKCNSRISLTAVSYKKQGTVNRRQECIIGTIEIPMLSIIAGRGIHGDYAFKNKYGIFVALSRCDISYDKTRSEAAVDPQLANTLDEKVFVLVNILELLNLGEPIKWVSFETQWPKQTTTRNHLSGNRIFSHLRNCTLLVQVDDLFSLTHISVQVKTSLDNKLSFEINTRPILNSLSKHRHTAFGAYFVVAGQQVQPIRIGAKVIAVKGSHLAEQFLARVRSSHIQVFDKLDVPRELDNYPKMMEIFRKELQVQKGAFDQYITYLLAPKQRLNVQILTSKIYFRLDFLQLYTQSPAELLSLCQQIPTTSVEEALDHIVSQDIQILGFKDEETLRKFTFNSLDLHRIDRNVQLYTMGDMVDLVVFLKKVGKPQLSSFQGDTSSLDKNYRIVIGVEKARNLDSLYNGIKPNAFVRCNALDLQTEVAGRESNPEYNQQFQFQLTSKDLSKIRKLHFQIHHKISLDQSSSQQVTIGRASVDISSALFAKPKESNSIMYSIPITPHNSHYKGSKKAEISIKIRTQRLAEVSYNQQNESYNEPSRLPDNSLKMDASVDFDRIDEIIKEDQNIHNQMFSSSESDEDSYER